MAEKMVDCFDNDIIVSVIVTTYGHENYIKQALDSILMQKVNFKYEILVGEDCSPDNTRKILEEYKNNYGDKFIMVYRDKNIGWHKNLLDLYTMAKGKYIAYLEGDDFWVCNDKLQTQVDFLENHMEYIATAHNVKVVDKNSIDLKNINYPECKNKIYTFKHYRKGILPGQTASIVRRNKYNDQKLDEKLLNQLPNKMPADRIMIFLLASHGKIYCFQKVMSAYRYVIDSGTSFSAMKKSNKDNDTIMQIEYYKIVTNHTQKYISNKEAIKTIEAMYFFYILFGFMHGVNNINYKSIKESWIRMSNKYNAIRYFFGRILRSYYKKMKSKVTNSKLAS